MHNIVSGQRKIVPLLAIFPVPTMFSFQNRLLLKNIKSSIAGRKSVKETKRKSGQYQLNIEHDVLLTLFQYIRQFCSSIQV